MGLLSKSEGKSIVFYGSNRIKNKNKSNSAPSYPVWKFLKLRSATTNLVTDVVNYKHELVTDHCKKTRQVSYFKPFFCFVFIIVTPPFPLQLINTKLDCKVVPVHQFGGSNKK